MSRNKTDETPIIAIKKPDYAIYDIKDRITELLHKLVDFEAPVTIEYPPSNIDADLAIPCFPFARILRNAPPKIAGELAQKLNEINSPLIEEAQAVGGYLNIALNRAELIRLFFQEYLAKKDEYGKSEVGKEKNIVIDYSHPNIAKPFSVGNIRSSIIGQAIYNLYFTLGYNVIGVNHLGDWGTQFGKLIYAYQTWGDEETVKRNPIKELLKLYVRFHKKAKEDETGKLEEEARKRFRLLEQGDEEIHRLWQWFVDLSLQEFNKIYDKLGMKFDYYTGESFYNDKLSEVVNILEEKNIGIRDEDGALVVRLEDYGIETPLLVVKSDGASLYATRELAALLHRTRAYTPELIIYVVGAAQKHQFQQCCRSFELMGVGTPSGTLAFGMVSLRGGKRSTRGCRVVFFEDVMKQADDRAIKLMNEKRPDLPEPERKHIAEIVAVGAIKFNDLSQNRTKDIVFDWDKMLSFEGNTAPYLQYSYARVKSILRKAQVEPEYSPGLLKEEQEKAVILTLAKFPEVLIRSAQEFAPHILAQYLLDTARTFTTFYSDITVLNNDDEKLTRARLGLVQAYADIIRQGLAILGIDVLERM